jgi:hypothetical protein
MKQKEQSRNKGPVINFKNPTLFDLLPPAWSTSYFQNLPKIVPPAPVFNT